MAKLPEAERKEVQWANIAVRADRAQRVCAPSPWSHIDQRDLDTVHRLWLAERITPHNGGTR
jgi:hypothetical protein